MINMHLTQKNFDQFLSNQEKFVETLNHRMTKIETDVAWIRKFVLSGIGILVAIFIAVVSKGV